MPTDELHDALHGWYPPPDLLTLSKMQVIPSALCCSTCNNVTCFTSCRERLTLIGPGLRKVSDFSRTYGRCSERAIGRLARAWSDIKMHFTPRLYPRRDHAASAVWDRLRNHCSPNHRELLERCFLALSAKPGGGTFDFAGFTRGAAGE